MKHSMKAAIVASLLMGGAAIAQTTTPNSGTGTTMPGSTSGNNTSMPGAAPGATMGTTPGATMGTTGTVSPGIGANSQATPPRTDSTAPAAVTTTTAPSRTAAAPVSGANSFTEAQARGRIEDKGFGNVTGLKKDDQGVWRGTAMKDGKSVSVALDYQGNIVGQ